jgi:hypothetical protein
VSISSTFFTHFFVRNFGAKQNVTRKKLPKQRSYKKRVQKMLMKLTTDLFHILDIFTDYDHPSFANYTTVASLLDCQLLCKNYSLIACNYFVYDCLTLTCWLKSQTGITLYNANAYSGRPTC